MYKKINISKEEKLLINILFKEDKLNKIAFDNIDYENVVKIASSHLMLPSLYINLKRKKYTNYIAEELRNYLYEIYKLNRRRNKILLKEAKELSVILNSNKIKHVFIKGTSNIIDGLYYDIGERMIGDIDILVNNEQAEYTYSLLKKLDYKPEEDRHFFLDKIHHYNRQINKNKIFAVEVHKKLAEKYTLDSANSKKIIKEKVILNKTRIPNKKHQLLINIYNYQLSDNGGLKLSYSYRNLYDSYLMLKNDNKILERIKFDMLITKYLMIVDELKVFSFKSKNYKIKKTDLLRFRIKKNNKLYSKFDNLLVESYRRLKWRPTQIKELFLNKEFRKYFFKKLLSK
jgi:hypothetical protein